MLWQQAIKCNKFNAPVDLTIQRPKQATVHHLLLHQEKLFYSEVFKQTGMIPDLAY